MAEENKTAQASVDQRIQEAGIKALEKATAKSVDEKVAQGQNPQEVLAGLMEMVQGLAATPTGPIPGSQVGLPGTIKGLLKGDLVSPFTPRQANLGVDGAFQLINLQRGLVNDERDIQQDQFSNALALLNAQINQNQEGRAAAKAPLEMQRLQQQIQNEKPENQLEMLRKSENIKREVKREEDLLLKANELFGRYETAAKPFITQTDAYNRMIASAEDNSHAGDLALIFNFMKVLDPGSTVREGEFANAQNSANVPRRIVGIYNRLVTNEGRLSDEQREDFLDRSKRLFNKARTQFDNDRKQFSKIASNNGINPENVFRDIPIPEPSRKQSEQVSTDISKRLASISKSTGAKITLVSE